MSNATRQTSSFDERYVVPLEASRRGAHRARVSPVMAALPVVAVVGIVVGAIVLVYVLFGKLGGVPDSSTQAPPSAAPTSGATASPSAAAPSAAEPTSASPSVTGNVDKTLPIAVYNATSTSGLARKVGNRLVAAGWTLGPVQSWTKGSVSATTVYYGTQEQRVTALAVAKVVGHASVRLSASKAGTGIAVVVAPDYPGAGAVGTTSTRTRSTTQNTDATATKSPKASKPTEPADGGATPSPTAAATSPTASPQG